MFLLRNLLKVLMLALATLQAQASTFDVLGSDCLSGLHTFNPLQHKSTYRVGVHAIRGEEAAYVEYNQTFSDYLTATAGQRFDPPLQFEMVPVTFQGLFDAVEKEELDFFYANPSIYSCVGTEVGAQPLVTITSRLEVRGHTYELDVFGGVIFTREGRDEINTITDLKDKIIGAGSISMIMAAQLQFYEMEKAGMSYVMDPKQVVFTGNQYDVVHGVLNGEFDVGFVRTDQIERTVDALGNPVDPALFKVIQPHIHILDDGNLFPFLHSTDIYPEWPVAALPHVNKEVAEEVQEALLAVGKHATLGHALETCEAKSLYRNTSSRCNVKELPEYSGLNARCDASNELAKLAWNASKVGKWAGFRTSRSYFEPRTMQEAAGFIVKDEKGNWKCTRAETLYDGIRCPAGHYKRSKREFDQACDRVQGAIPCRDSYDCFCKPCVRAYEVTVYEYEEGDEDSLISDYYGGGHEGCAKMSVCGQVQQTKPITFRAYDNKERAGAHVKVVMHDEDKSQELAVTKLNGTWAYEFSWSESHVGVGIMEIFVDDEQIPESPIRVQVVPRDCDIDHHGQGRVSDTDGSCICGGGTIELGGKCVSSAVFFVIIAAILLLIVLEAGYCFIGYKKRQSDQLWLVNVEELHFDQPVEIIGQGAFGVVLKAEYRGTTVAIKRVLTPGEKSRREKDGTGSREGSLDSGDKVGAQFRYSTTSSPGSVDLEVQSDAKTHESESSGGFGSTSKELVTQSSSPSEIDEELGLDLGLDFLSGGFSFGRHGRSRWERWCPWFFQDERSALKSSILGSASGSVSKSTTVTTFCPCLDAQSRQKNEFIQEMRLLSRLRHPCITTVMGAVMGSGHEPMLVMEFCEYGSLYDLLRNETMYTGGEIILQIVRDIAQGLRYLHASKPPILHGDLKAKNILVDSRFRAKVGDFGLSTKKKHGLSGTPYWMAPEYLRGKTDFNCTCDIYSMGIIIYEIYSRKIPYEGENPRQVLRKVCDPRINKRPPVPDCCPPKMADIMKKCWSQDPFFRPQAKDLDTLFMDMNMQEAEPLSKEHGGAGHARKERPTGDMLYQVFPKHIADALNAGEKVEPETHENVTVFFSDVVHFTDISSSISPIKVSSMLDRLYLAFDNLARRHKVFKVETIGDAWMGVTNLDGSQDDNHAKAIAEFAIDAVEAAGQILIDEDDPKRGYVRIRAGFHSGQVVSNVIGSLNPRYCLFGDTVNVASRMESNSVSRKIQCSEKSAKLLSEQAPKVKLTKRGKIGIKGKGEMTTFFVGDSRKNRSFDDKDKPQVDFACNV